MARKRLLLCDTNLQVCRALEGQWHNTPLVEVLCGDGYLKARELSGLDLVFIDPPDIQGHFERFMGLLRHCLREGKPFVSWNPLHGDDTGSSLSRNCRAVADLARQQGIPSVTARWTSGWPVTMCGCQMLFSMGGGQRVAQACDPLIKLMGWK